MGSWGTSIFTDDVAVDVRDAFVDLIGQGLTPRGATTRLKRDFAEVLDDDEEANVFWLALAATQWKLGRLLDDVRKRAIRIIDTEADLPRWREDNASLARWRQRQLDKLRRQLLSPQPAPKRVRRRVKSSTTFKAGDIVRYQLDGTISLVFCVAHVWADLGGAYSNIRLLCVDKGQPIDPALFGPDLARPDRQDEYPKWRNFTMIGKEPLDRITILLREVQLPEWRSPTMIKIGSRTIGGAACTWPHFDEEAGRVINLLGWA